MEIVLIIEASGRKGFSSAVARHLQDEISKSAQVERIQLRDYTINRCKGCCACLSHGSASCPLKDDDVRSILEKMEQSDGVIFVTPNYSLSVPGILKDLFDRLAFVFHRPRLFGRVCMPVIIQGVYGGNKVGKYINDGMGFWGMNPVNGIVVAGGITPDQDATSSAIEKNRQNLTKAVDRFARALENTQPVQPTIFRLMIFRATRSGMKYFPEALAPDREYYEKKGWLQSDYYYDVKINPFKKALGSLVDTMMRRMAAKEKAKSKPDLGMSR